ncbi:MAG: protein-glutamate O-methyltransferase CheR [Nitrospira sp.]|nr:protein-glutamate O-methyltransferase CheR [Nitrospira sp.]
MLTTKNIQLSEKVFSALRSLIYERSGIFFPDNKKYVLETRLARRIEDGGFETFDKYVDFLNRDPQRERELTTLFEIITTNETSFFRDLNQLQVFELGILSKLMKSLGETGNKKLRLWSAACSTGEEPYTMAMQILNRLPQGVNSDWDIEIHATDISEGVLHSARRGEYNDYSIRNVPPQYLTKFFSKNENGKYGIKPEVKRLVRFSNVNLFDSMKLRVFRGMNVVFCRNVLIYFDEASKKKVINSIYDCLTPGGYLFIGHAESLFNISRAFKLVNIDNLLVYQK